MTFCTHRSAKHTLSPVFKELGKKWEIATEQKIIPDQVEKQLVSESGSLDGDKCVLKKN